MQGSSEPAQPDWPAPDAPLPADEPTIELPVIKSRDDVPTGEPGWHGPTLARAALDLALSNHKPGPRHPGPEDPVTRSPDTEGPDTDGPDTDGPDTDGPDTDGPDTGDADLEEHIPREQDQRPGTTADRTGWPVAVPTGAARSEWSTGAFAVVNEGPAPWHAKPRPEEPEHEQSWQEQPRQREPAPQEPALEGPGQGAPASGAPAQEKQEQNEHEAVPVPGRRWMIGAAVAAVGLVLTGVAVLAIGTDGSGDGVDDRQWTPPAAAAGQVVTGARGDRTAAGFDLVDGARSVTVRTADLGDGLFRVRTKAGKPQAELRGGQVRVRLSGNPEAVEVTLSSRVRWDLRVTGGADRSMIDLRQGRVAEVELAGGASQISLALPPPDGTLTVRMSGGASLLDVQTAAAVPVRVRVGHGAGRVVLDGQTHQSVAPGGTFAAPAWADASDRVDLDAVAGVATLTVAEAT
ncbi:hypothetical protein [Actinoplanes sp. N902-109]|uniref:hypothetical protein n=1 Tax=Actinoplanes sp. (strain N902-109) TaxID=649831 RepID=UPI0003293DF2|nr:hypothetical protein [Actinoplanes sp. N902-109]AGL17961.1 hypothetical protein L083_4451 [Actinoplanes sp. N902-109]